MWTNKALSWPAVALLAVIASSRLPALAGDAFAASTTNAGSTATPEILAAGIVEKLTLREKLHQLTNTAPAIPRLGIPAYQWWTEALHGVWGGKDPTDFPEPIGLAATFDDGLVRDVASTISDEIRSTHALTRIEGGTGLMGGGLDVWAPNINIFRDPRWGRGQETYGEDPFLTARMGVAYIEGMQGPDPDHPAVIATPKHFAVHSGPEPMRHTIDVPASAHDLEDTYLPAFRAAIVEAKAGSIMCSYNSLNGQPACASDFLLKETLRGAWGFKGYVVSDCDALKDIQTGHKYASSLAAAVADALKAGVDNECTVDGFTGADSAKRYADAIAQGLLSEADIDKALIRLFAARIRAGDIAPDGRGIIPGVAPVVKKDAHLALARRAAEESLVLLKNAGVLPLPKAVKKIVVTGPLAANIRVLLGNYSTLKSAGPVSVLEGLKAEFPSADIRYVPAAQSLTDGDPVPQSVLTTPDGSPGVHADYFVMKNADPAHPLAALMNPAAAYDAKPLQSVVVQKIGTDSTPSCRNCKAVYSGVLVAPETGDYRIGVQGVFVKVDFNGTMVGSNNPLSSLPVLQTFHLEKGHRYPFHFEAVKTSGFDGEFVWQPISSDPASELRSAAQDADVVVAVVGLTSDLESEESQLHAPGFAGGDRTTLDLPVDQQQLLEAAKATGKKLVVINMTGSPTNLSWAKQNADAVIQAWYPGDEGGTAVARILSGEANPAGRLPVTFYGDVSSLPPFEDYSMKGRTYRYYTGTPVYPFGYGLSFTTFAYAPLEIHRNSASGGDVVVRTVVKNVGATAGDEVSELYLQFPNVPGVPQIALRGFRRLHLEPQQSGQIEFRLTPRDMSSVSELGIRRVLAGTYRFSVGSGQPGTGVPVSTASYKIGRSQIIAK